MSKIIYHECGQNDSDFAVRFTNDNWVLTDIFSNTNWSFGIHRCPYCGKELGRPDVKIEISSKVLVAMNDKLWGARLQLHSVGYKGLAATGALDAIQEVSATILAILRGG